jgi:hypothetical protein
MGMTNVSGTKPYVTDIPQGTHIATCVGLFDIGTVFNAMHNKHQRKLVMLFEFAKLMNPEGFPKTINQDYTISLDPKATLYKHLQSWRGTGFEDEEEKSYNVKEFALGRPAMLQIIHQKGKGAKADNKYANINNILEVPDGIRVPDPTSSLLYFDFDEGRAEIPEGTPEFIAKKIAASPEWQELVGGGGKPAANGAAKAPARSNQGQQAPREIVDTLNEIGLGYPYTQEELDAKFPPDMSQDAYEILSKHATPF